MPIRDVQPDDAEHLEPLFEAWGHPADPPALRARIERLLADPGYAMWVHEAGERGANSRIRGFAAAHLVHPVTDDVPAAQLIGLATVPDAREQGVGTALVEHAESWARAQGAARMLITSATERVDTHRFYEHRGYAITGMRFTRRL